MVRSLIIRARSAVAAVLALAAFAVASGAPPRLALADTLDEQVAQLKEMVRAGDETGAVTRIGLFEKERDRRVDSALLAIAKGNDNDLAAKAAMRVLAMHADSSFLSWAKSRLGDRRLRDDSRNRYVAILEALPAAGDALKPCVPALVTCVEETMRTLPEVSTRAVRAVAAYRDKSVVPRLIGLLEEADGAEGGGGGARGGLPAPPLNGAVGGGGDPRANLQAAKSEIFTCLKELTGAEGGNVIDWKLWWRANEKTWRPPTPEPDWTRLVDFHDGRTGLVLARPDAGDRWTWEKSPYSRGRARLRFGDANDMLACVDVMVYATEGLAGPEAYAKQTAEMWRSVEFAGFLEDGDPAIEKKRIGGRPFAVLRAHGYGTGSTWGAWDDCERRLYVAATDDGSFVCLEAAARRTLDAAVREALWKALDGVTFDALK